jgi:hypothetical protein
MFFFGCIGGWSLAAWSRSPIGALLGFAISAAFGAWVTITYYRTRGLMARPKPYDRGSILS